MVNVYKVNNKKQLMKFIRFPMKLYRGNSCYVPPLISDEITEFDPKKNGAHTYSETQLFLAEKDGKIVGRIGCILNKAFNEKENVKQVRFTRFDFIDDKEVSKALVDAAEAWAKEHQMNELIGPMGYSDLDKQGMLIEGFDETAMYIEIYNYPYYREHMEALGFSKLIDWIGFKLYRPEKIDERLERMIELIQKKHGYEVLTFDNLKDTQPYWMPALKVMNEAYYKLFGTVLLTDRQLSDFTKTLKMIAIPDYIVIIKKDGKVIGYGFMAPCISEAMQKAKGHIFPTGIFHIIKAVSKKNKKVDMYSVGVLPEYQAKGANALILYEGIKACMKNKVEYAETGPELETNVNIQGLWKYLDRRQNKRRRCYTKKLDEA